MAVLTYLFGPRYFLSETRQDHSLCPGSVWRRARQPGNTLRLHIQLHASPCSELVCHDRRRRPGPQGPPPFRCPCHSSRIPDDQIYELHHRSSGTQNDMRLSSGIVFRFGGNPGHPPPQPCRRWTYSCSVNPAAVFPGDTIAVSGTAVNLNPAKTAVYTWSVDGGTVTGTSETATIDTKQACCRRLHSQRPRL